MPSYPNDTFRAAQCLLMEQPECHPGKQKQQDGKERPVNDFVPCTEILFFHYHLSFPLLFPIICHQLLYRPDDILHIPVCHGIKQGNTHYLFIIFFRIRTKPFFVTKLFIIGMPINRQIMHLRADILRIQRIKKLTPVAGQLFRIQP